MKITCIYGPNECIYLQPSGKVSFFSFSFRIVTMTDIKLPIYLLSQRNMDFSRFIAFHSHKILRFFFPIFTCEFLFLFTFVYIRLFYFYHLLFLVSFTIRVILPFGFCPGKVKNIYIKCQNIAATTTSTTTMIYIFLFFYVVVVVVVGGRDGCIFFTLIDGSMMKPCGTILYFILAQEKSASIGWQVGFTIQ